MPPVSQPTADAAATPSADSITAFVEPSLGDLDALLNGKASLSPAPAAADDDDSDGNDIDEQAADSADATQDEDADTEASAEDDAADESDAEADEAGDDDLDEEGKKARATFTPAQQRIFDREIAKVKRKAREASAAIETEAQAKADQLAQLTAEVEQLRNAQPAATVAPTPESPLAGVDDEAELEKRIDQARLERRWALRNPQGGVVPDGKGGEIEISEERAADMLAAAEDLIEKHAPKRRDFLRARTQGEQVATQTYPWLKDPKHAATIQVEAVLRKHPQLRETFSDARLWLAHALVGLTFTQQQLAAQQKQAAPSSANGKTAGATTTTTKPTAPKAPASPAGGTRAPAVKTGTRTRQAALQKFAETGEDTDGAALGALLSGAG